MKVNWLAHQLDDWSIKSGTLQCDFEAKDKTTSHSWADITKTIKNPGAEAPLQLFLGLSYIDIKGNANDSTLDVLVEATPDKNGCRFYSLNGSWGFSQLDASYVAIR
jgi:hypothetical protein